VRYTVVWRTDASEALTKEWLSAKQRQAVSDAADRIDQRLADSPREGALSATGDLFRLTVPPLSILYAIREDDRIVEVIAVRSLTLPLE
jgi:mRNA-degrading endonuclease RelE of RelBE toxin-antitoxin system